MSYIGTPPKDVRSFGKAQFDFTATQGQTVFTGADDDSKTLGFTEGQIQVHVNGVLLDGSDYSTSNNNTVTLSAAANANDVLTVLALQTDIPNSDYVPISGGTFSGDVTFGDNDKAIFGAGSDLQIYHDGSNSYIKDAGTGQLILQGAAQVKLQSAATGDDMLKANSGSDVILYHNNAAKLATTSTGVDVTGTITSDRLTVDGDLLVGTTSFNTGVAGGGITNYGFNYGTVDGGLAARFTRLTSDGDIVQFRKDGSTVGSIGVLSSRMMLGTDDVGIFFDSITDNAVEPSHSTTGPNNGVIDLGSSGARWKDLYLSGGAYLGGTGAANKLEDYEEGTFTPTVTFGGNSAGQVYGVRTGLYTKIGQTVTVQLYFTLTAKGTSTGNAKITGMPFACKGGYAYSAGSLHLNAVSFTGFPQAYNTVSSTKVTLGETTDAGVFSPLNNTNFANYSGVIFTATYQTDA